MRLFAFLLLLACSSSGFAASFYMGGVCYSDVAAIAEVWESKFPAVSESTNYLNYTAFNTTVSATGLMTYEIDQQNIQTGAVNPGRVNTTQLMDCTPKNSLVAVGKVDRTIIVFAMMLFFILGFQFGHRFFSNNVAGE